MESSHQNVLEVLENLQAELLSCDNSQERASLRTAIRKLRAAQGSFDPNSNLRRSRRKFVNAIRQPVKDDSTDQSHSFTSESNGNMKNSDTTFAGTSLRGSDVTFDKASVKTGVLANIRVEKQEEDRHSSNEISYPDQSARDNDQDHHPDEPAELSKDETADHSRRKSRSRSSISHILKLKSPRSSHKDPEEHPQLSSPSAEEKEEKGFGKRRFSKRFRRQARKASSEQLENEVEPGIAPTPPSTGVVDGIGKKTPASPTPLTSPVPQVQASHDNHFQRKRSSRDIRRVIGRIFSPRHKHTIEVSSDKQLSSSSHQQTDSSSHSNGTSSVVNRLNSSTSQPSQVLTAPLPSATVLNETNCEQNIMAQVLYHPHDVAVAPSGGSSLVPAKNVTANEHAVSHHVKLNLNSNQDQKGRSSNVTNNNSKATTLPISLVSSKEGESSVNAKEKADYSDTTAISVDRSKSSASENTSSAPWAPAKVKKSSFRSVRCVTPPSRPKHQDPLSAPPSLRTDSVSKESSSATPTGLSKQLSRTSTDSRFGKREFSTSFKITRPSTYTPPAHVQTRAGSFRLARPKDLIKEPSVQQPTTPSNFERLNFKSSGRNLTSTPLSSTSHNKDLPPHLSPVTSSPTQSAKSSSLQRSESCKENQRNRLTESASPISGISKGRSQRILSRVLSLKIDSEKASRHRQLFQRSAPASSSPDRTSTSTESSNSVGESKLTSGKEVAKKSEAASTSASESPIKESLPEDRRKVVDQVTTCPVEEPSGQHLLKTGYRESSEKVREASGTFTQLDDSFDFLNFLEDLLQEVELLVDKKKQEKEQSSIANNTCHPSKLVSSLPLAISTTEEPQPSLLVFCESLAHNIVENFLLENSVRASLERSKEAFDPPHSSADSSDSDSDFEGEMEGRYSLRSRNNDSSGSVKSHVQSTESWITTTDKSTGLKRNRPVVDARMFRNTEGVRSRMNKFATATSPPGSKSVISRKLDVAKQPDANNNVDAHVITVESTASLDCIPRSPQSKVSSTTTTVRHVNSTSVPAINGLAQSPTAASSDQSASIKSDREQPAEVKADAPTRKVVNGEPNKPVSNSTAPLAVAVSHVILPHAGDTLKVVVNGVAKTKESLIVKEAADKKDKIECTNDNITTPATTIKDPSISEVIPTSPDHHDASGEKSSLLDVKPIRTRRRRSSNKEAIVSSCVNTQNSSTDAGSSPAIATSPKAADTLEVPTKAVRRRRRVRRSTDVTSTEVTSTSGSTASTPDRDVVFAAPESPGTPNETKSIVVTPNETATAQQEVTSIANKTSEVEKSAEVSRDACISSAAEKKESDDVVRANKNDLIKLKRVRSVPMKASRHESESSRKACDKEIPSIDATLKGKVEEKDTEIEDYKTKNPPKEMAPQTGTVVRYTMDNIGDCKDETVLKKMLDQAKSYDERRTIRGLIRTLKREQTAESSDKLNSSSPPNKWSSEISTVHMEKSIASSRIGSAQVTQQSHNFSMSMTRTTNNFNADALSEKYSLKSTRVDAMSTGTKKVGSIFDRDEDPPKSSHRVMQTDKRREISRNRSMPSSSSKDARKLLIAKLEGDSASKSGSKKVGRSPTFVVPNANNVKQLLLKWCQSKTRSYENVDITNFSRCWADGMAFCALVHNFFPDSFDFNELDPKNRAYNFELAFTKAEELANADPLLDVEDMMIMGNRPDSKCVFTYVQSLYNKLRKFEKPLKPITPTEVKEEAT